MAFEGSSCSGSTSRTTEHGMKTPWTPSEDMMLLEYIRKHGEGNWSSIQKEAGLKKSGKSCRNRWANYLRPNLKKGAFSAEEEKLIIALHGKFGNKWARIAAQLPGRTDNEVKNYWNIRLKKSQRSGLAIHHQEMCQINQPLNLTFARDNNGDVALSLMASNELFSSPTSVTMPSVNQISPNSFPALPVQENYLNFGVNQGPNKGVLGLQSMQSPEMVASTLRPLSSYYVAATPNNGAEDFEVIMQGTKAEASGSGTNFIDELSRLLNDSSPLASPLAEWDDLHPRLCLDLAYKY